MDTPTQALAASLLRAAELGNMTAARVLLETGTDAWVQDEEGLTPFHIAARKGHVAFLDLYLHIAPPQTSNRPTSAEEVTDGNDLHHPHRLHYRASVINSLDAKGRTALLWCVRERQSVGVTFLLKHGADPTIPDVFGNAPMHFAVERRDLTTIQAMMDASPSATNARDALGHNAEDLAYEMYREAVASKSFRRFQRLWVHWYIKLLQQPKWRPALDAFDTLQSNFAAGFYPVCGTYAAFMCWYKLWPTIGWYWVLHLGFWSWWLLSLVSYVASMKADPGFLVDTDHEPNSPESHSLHHQYLLAVGDVSVLDDGQHDEDASGGGSETAQRLASQYCPTCRIKRPVRSKHCRKADRCCRKFDHNCPWIANTVGVDNYRLYILFIVSATMTAFLFCILFVLYLKHLAFLNQTTFMGTVWNHKFEVFFALNPLWMGLFGLLLIVQHFRLITMALTTNELKNYKRYPYLKHPQNPTRYFNPYSLGNWRANLLRFFGVVRRNQRGRRQASSSRRHQHSHASLEGSEAL